METPSEKDLDILKKSFEKIGKNGLKDCYKHYYGPCTSCIRDDWTWVKRETGIPYLYYKKSKSHNKISVYYVNGQVDVADLKVEAISSDYTATIHPSLLTTLSQTHPWVLGAIAELIHNACDSKVKANEVCISLEETFGQQTLIVQDDGVGMTRDELLGMLRFGRERSNEEDGRISRYGIGFKTGSMRIGDEAWVFTKTKKDDTYSIGLLSKSLSPNEEKDVILRTPVYTKKALIGQQKDNDTEEQKKILADYFPESSITDNIDSIGWKNNWLRSSDTESNHQGTVIMIRTLKNMAGKPELESVEEGSDIQLSRTKRNEIVPFIPYRKDQRFSLNAKIKTNFSLRSYCEMMFLRPIVTIKIGGEVVVPLNILKHLKDPEPITQQVDKLEIMSVMGKWDSTKSPSLAPSGVAGWFLYWNNVLIEPYSRLHYSSSNVTGFFGVAELPIQPNNNKQGFDLSSDECGKIFKALSYRFDGYVTAHDSSAQTRVSDQGSSSRIIPSLRQKWAQCTFCMNWRKIDPKFVVADDFRCQDIENRRCEEECDSKNDDSRVVSYKGGDFSYSISNMKSIHEVEQKDYTRGKEIDSIGGIKVYEGCWKGVSVALRVFDDGQKEQFVLEKGFLESLLHPCISQRFFFCEDSVTIGSELLVGYESLTHRLESGSLTSESRIRIARDVASGLDYLASLRCRHAKFTIDLVKVSCDPEAYSVKIIDIGSPINSDMDDSSNFKPFLDKLLRGSKGFETKTALVKNSCKEGNGFSKIVEQLNELLEKEEESAETADGFAARSNSDFVYHVITNPSDIEYFRNNHERKSPGSDKGITPDVHVASYYKDGVSEQSPWISATRSLEWCMWHSLTRPEQKQSGHIFLKVNVTKLDKRGRFLDLSHIATQRKYKLRKMAANFAVDAMEVLIEDKIPQESMADARLIDWVGQGDSDDLTKISSTIPKFTKKPSYQAWRKDLNRKYPDTLHDILRAAFNSGSDELHRLEPAGESANGGNAEEETVREPREEVKRSREDTNSAAGGLKKKRKYKCHKCGETKERGHSKICAAMNTTNDDDIAELIPDLHLEDE